MSLETIIQSTNDGNNIVGNGNYVDERIQQLVIQQCLDEDGLSREDYQWMTKEELSAFSEYASLIKNTPDLVKQTIGFIPTQNTYDHLKRKIKARQRFKDL
jgi:hypothetical protein